MAKSLTNAVQFGNIQIPSSQLFILRKNVYAMVNLKPILQGHVLVCPRRQAIKLSDLTEMETLDFWVTIQEVAKVFNDLYKSDCQITIQNGEAAGQTIQHVHCHILPKGQHQIQTFDDEERQPRSLEEMHQEAQKYRAYFEQSLL